MATAGVDTGWRIALVAAGWLVGIAWQLRRPVLWPLGIDWLLCATAAASLVVAWRWRRTWALIIVAALGLGLGHTGWRAHATLDELLPAALEGRDLLVTGVVAALPQVSAAGTRFVFEVESARLGNRSVAVPPRIALGWYRNDADEAQLEDPRAELRAGQRWRLPVRLKQPHGAMNPAGFDVELWWWEQGLRATGYVRVARGGPVAERVDESGAHPIERLRQSIRDSILRHVADARTAGVLAALVVGDQAAIERDDWALFRNTGIAHLMSISGLHVTMFAWVAGALIGWGWRRSTRLMLRLPTPLAARWGGLAVATGYALLAGWGVPAERTLLMLACAVLLKSAGARWPWLLVLLVAGVVVTLFDPWALLQAGFWLSFAAVGLLLASEAAQDAPPGKGWRAALRGQLRSQLVASIGLAPLSMVFFQQVSIVGFLANLIAIPLVTLLITPLALLGVIVAPLWQLAALAVQAMVAGLAWMAGWPLAVWTAAAAPAWAMACGMAGALLGVLPLPRRVRLLAIPLVLPLLLPAVARLPEGAFEAVVADVGQGTAVLVRTRGHLLLYDTGPQYSRDSDAGQRVLLPLLRARGEKRIDALVLSHRDGDHVGGAASVLGALPVAQVLSSLEPDHPLVAKALSHQRCEDGHAWAWDGVRFELLHPLAADYAVAHKPNAICCVLKVTDARGRSLLLTGDIEAPQEAALLRRHGAELPSTLLLVPHHGSRTSSSAEFLNAVQPQAALVQAGYRSRFGHPAPDVMARYDDRGIAVLRTDRCGAWLWHDGAAACTRDVQRRYWHWVAPGGGANVALNIEAGDDKP